MTSQYSSNSADHGANVGIQVGFMSGGNINQEMTNTPAETMPGAEISLVLSAQIAELRQAVLTALQRAELTETAASAAQAELDVAAREIADAARGQTQRLMASLDRVRAVLSSGLNVLASLATVVATVKGIT
jgi:hypothetical protein